MIIERNESIDQFIGIGLRDLLKLRQSIMKT